MHLSTIEIKNFRCFESFTANFAEGLNILVGRNNTGKTNLLAAVRHALGPSAARGDGIWLDRDDFYRSSSEDAKERTITIKLTFTGLSESQRAHFFEITDFNLSNLADSKAVVRFEASWPKGKRQASIKRCGGSEGATEIPPSILESLPITFLPALRDAEASLAPGFRNRLASLLQDLAARRQGDAETRIKEIYRRANRELEQHPLIGDTKSSLSFTTKELAGSDYSESSIRATDVEFQKILRSLQIQMDGSPIGTLDANGLGYNNLLYVAVVLEHLRSADSHECPLLLVEEPEAHLHPQLTVLLARYLDRNRGTEPSVQTIVTTHSPTLASAVTPNKVSITFAGQSKRPEYRMLRDAMMTTREMAAFQRMLDITRATLYFAKGIILVEGISEALLIPVLAKRLGHDLSKLHVSVIPICGVAFNVFKKVLSPNALTIPVSIITDGDPDVIRGQNWCQDQPARDGRHFKISATASKIVHAFADSESVGVFHSQVTLEYDLAEANAHNSIVMATAWESCFESRPGTLNISKVTDAGSSRLDRAMAVWRGICRASHTGSKAEFAHALANLLSEQLSPNVWEVRFRVPQYIKNAIDNVVADRSLLRSVAKVR